MILPHGPARRKYIPPTWVRNSKRGPELLAVAGAGVQRRQDFLPEPGDVGLLPAEDAVAQYDGEPARRGLHPDQRSGEAGVPDPRTVGRIVEHVPAQPARVLVGLEHQS